MSANTFTRIKRVFPTYTLISFICLVLDSSIYSLLVWINFPIPISATFGYLCGLFLSYILLTQSGINNEEEKVNTKRVIFAMTGVIGVITTFVSSSLISSYLTQNPAIVKIISVVISFSVVFLLRNKYVFE